MAKKKKKLEIHRNLIAPWVRWKRPIKINERRERKEEENKKSRYAPSNLEGESIKSGRFTRMYQRIRSSGGFQQPVSARLHLPLAED